jgi:hypothetical protein
MNYQKSQYKIKYLNRETESVTKKLSKSQD